MLGIRTAALYGIYPCDLGLCGPQEMELKKVLSRYLSEENVSEQELRSILEKFVGAYPYYKLIAESNEINDFFDDRVVRAYWIGNELLENIPVDSFKKMILDFSDLGFLSKESVQEKLKNVSNITKPHHSFHVFSIGSVTGTVELKGRLLDICRVNWGEVIDKKEGKIIVRYQPIEEIDGKYSLMDSIEKDFLWNKAFVPNLEIGDKVSCHWGNVVEVIKEKDINNLRKYTNLTLNSIIKE